MGLPDNEVVLIAPSPNVKPLIENKVCYFQKSDGTIIGTSVEKKRLYLKNYKN